MPASVDAMVREAGMSEGFSSAFHREEMAAIRKSLRDEARFGSEFWAG